MLIHPKTCALSLDPLYTLLAMESVLQFKSFNILCIGNVVITGIVLVKLRYGNIKWGADRVV